MKKQLIAASLITTTLAVQAPLIPAIAQTTNPVISQAQKPLPPESNVDVKSNFGFGLEDGTEVLLKFKEEVSSKTAEPDQPVKFEVAEDVWVKNRLVIPKGAPAKGYIKNVKRAGMLGRKGKLEISLKEVTIMTGERVTLRANREKGGEVSAGVIAVAALINPLFLLIKGKNITYAAGTEFKAYVSGDFELEQAKFTTTSTTVTPRAASSTTKPK